MPRKRQNGRKFSRPTLIVPGNPLWLECECKHREWAVRGYPQNGGLKISQLICMKCKLHYKVDTSGKIGGFVGSGKLTKIIPTTGPDKGKELDND